MQLKLLFLGKNNALSEILKFLKIWMRLNGIIFTRISLETFEEVLAAARKDMMQLLASGHNEEYNFGSDAAECTLVLIRMISSCQIGYFPQEEMEMKHAFVNESTYDESETANCLCFQHSKVWTLDFSKKCQFRSDVIKGSKLVFIGLLQLGIWWISETKNEVFESNTVSGGYSLSPSD